MKRLTILLLCAAIFTAGTTVYCEAATVPAATTIIEKAVMPTLAPAYFDRAITNLTPLQSFQLSEGTFVATYKLAKIHWVVDETFYTTGYKSTLNKRVREIFAPPRS